MNIADDFSINIDEEIEEALDPDQCGICLLNLEDGRHTYQLPECGHVFHTNCILPWFRINKGCPYCRAQPADNMYSNCFHSLYRFNSNYSRRKNAPVFLKNIVRRLKKKKESIKRTKKRLRELKQSDDYKTYKRVSSRLVNLNESIWNQGVEAKNIMFEVANYPIRCTIVKK